MLGLEPNLMWEVTFDLDSGSRNKVLVLEDWDLDDDDKYRAEVIRKLKKRIQARLGPSKITRIHKIRLVESGVYFVGGGDE